MWVGGDQNVGKNAPLKKNGIVVDDAKRKATVLNEEYANIFTVENTNIC